VTIRTRSHPIQIWHTWRRKREDGGKTGRQSEGLAATNLRYLGIHSRQTTLTQVVSKIQKAAFYQVPGQ
jgi:hypothetical protein